MAQGPRKDAGDTEIARSGVEGVVGVVGSWTMAGANRFKLSTQRQRCRDHFDVQNVERSKWKSRMRKKVDTELQEKKALWKVLG
jgi:hypothetical protein